MTAPASGTLDILDTVRKAMEVEITNLRHVQQSLDERVAQAVRLIRETAGVVYVSGVGKSGIVAQKIASTFRSTGTRAVYLDPLAALHGDVGTVGKGDTALLVGKSGESTELNTLARACQHRSVPIITVTAVPDSSLAQLSTVVVETPVLCEAGLGLAPTASTTVALAVGDALAVTLAELRGQTPEDFARNHPGGQLGRRLTWTAGDVMRTGDACPSVTVYDTVRTALLKITAGQTGAVCVVNPEGVLAGIITDYDFRRMLEQGSSLDTFTVATLLNPNPRTVTAVTPAVDVLRTMTGGRKRTSVVPVTDGQRLVGVVHISDLLNAGL